MIRRTLHSICEIPMEGGEPGSTIPVLILEDGEISLYALAWSRHQKIRQELSSESLRKSAEAVGRMYDFYKIKETKLEFSKDEFRALIGRFMDSRRSGDHQLGWTPVGKDTAFDDVRRVCEFAEFTAGELNDIPVSYREKTLIRNLSIPEQQGIKHELAHRDKWDKLKHLFPTTDLGKGITTKNFLRPPKRGRSNIAQNQMYFPPHLVLPFIKAAATIRDKLIFILMFFGSLRISEPLHLYSTDIIVLPNDNAKIILQHPATGHFNWEDTFRGKRTGYRSVFLNERYGLGPRNKLGTKDPLHSGWKGMTFDNNRLETEVYWLLPEIGVHFASLHQRYMHSIRSNIPDLHPYYFVNQKNTINYGKPVTLSNITKIFQRTAEKIGLSATHDGVNPHGARHFYGYFCASYLRLDIHITRRMMHHATINSTETYYSLDKRVVHEELRKAQEKLALEIPAFFKALISEVEDKLS